MMCYTIWVMRGVGLVMAGPGPWWSPDIIIIYNDKPYSRVNVCCCGNIYSIFGHVHKLTFLVVNFW